MKKILVGLLLTTAALGLARSAGAGETVVGNVDVLFGQKLLMPSDWDFSAAGLDISKQLEIGLMTDIRLKDWPVNIAVQYLTSSADDSKDGVKLEGDTSELGLGVRKYFMEESKWIPYAGLGIANIYAKQKDDIESLSGSSWGPWVDAGVKYKIIPQLNLGLNGRYSYAKIDMGDDVKVEGGGWHWGVFLGWAF